ncbi:PREDICTED: DNA mismatch repair protein Mlh3-like [Ceratosolen solmsi marchali]|uniref:DNA mismatch repair protein Mlh3-like n=1 Tax=Ceratosolen solmsi marchali TaxID=326594 RepID=A0AAJ6YFQ1_9HYME|nr:PREDICTED: DNA mismatch repair protein Mlh3-like [Ceratosolen solmsi marchali]
MESLRIVFCIQYQNGKIGHDRKILNEQNYLQSSQCSSFNFNNTESNYIINETTKSFQNVNVRVCNLKRKFDEYKISRNTIHSIQVLKQINKEFIAAITNEKDKKVLIIIDQHAVHERIRYEGLIECKKNSYDYLSVKLNKELHISDISEKLLELIVLHKEVFNRVGINVKSVIDSTTCLIDAVPECFIKKVKSYNKENNFYRLMKNVRQLLLEIANGLAISTNILPPILPITIHNVIASEACHEAIKFGDPLNVDECLLLIQALQDTKAPIRCAHGRPSIIPLIDLADIEKRKSSENKILNFDSLKTKT